MQEEPTIEREILLGQRWRERTEKESWGVAVIEGDAPNRMIQMSGPGPLRGIYNLTEADFRKEWVFIEPQLKRVLPVIDKVMRHVIKQDPESPEVATELLRAKLMDVRGHLPSWMPPGFWKVEFDVMQNDKLHLPGVKVKATSYTAIPTILSGRRIEFTPTSNGMKAVLPNENIFTHAPDAFECVVGLARILQTKGSPP